MTRTVLAMLVALLLAAEVLPVSAQPLQPDARPGDPVIARAEVVFFDRAVQGLCPSLVRAAIGDLIVATSTRGDAMPTTAVAMHFVRSSDQGKTWSAPFMTSHTDKPLTGLSESLLPLPGGRILRYSLELVWPAAPDQARPDYEALAGGRKFDSSFALSDDNGVTFSERTLLSDPVKRDDFAQGGIVQLRNGDLLWSWGHWGSAPLNGFKRSTDGGKTWGPVARAFQDPPPGFAHPLAFNETGVAVCPDGAVVAVARVDGCPPANDKRFWLIRSRDNGQTWSVPRQIPVMGGSPALYCTPRGQLWLAYRDGGLGPGLGLAVSDDQGDTWRFLYHLKEPMGNHERLYGQIRWTDEDRRQPWRPAEGQVGYPCFCRLSDTEVYVVYHASAHPTAPHCYIAGNLLRTEPSARVPGPDGQ